MAVQTQVAADQVYANRMQMRHRADLVNAAQTDSELGFSSALGKHAHGAPDVRDCRTNETAAACKETALAT